MARVKELMTSLDAGDATELSPSQLQDLGVSDAQGAKQKTALSSELEFLIQRGTTGRVQCPVYFVLDEVDSEIYKKLTTLIDETQVSASKISALLTKYDLSVSHYAIQRHRRRFKGGGCRCPK
jgi:hypothetical protein